MRDFDCQTCGACCTGLDVLLDEAEVEFFLGRPELARFVRRHPWPGGPELYFLRRDAATDCCLAFEGTHARCRCTIYAQRPRLCRLLQPGDPDCLSSRRRDGLDT